MSSCDILDASSRNRTTCSVQGHHPRKAFLQGPSLGPTSALASAPANTYERVVHVRPPSLRCPSAFLAVGFMLLFRSPVSQPQRRLLLPLLRVPLCGEGQSLLCARPFALSSRGLSDKSYNIIIIYVNAKDRMTDPARFVATVHWLVIHARAQLGQRILLLVIVLIVEIALVQGALDTWWRVSGRILRCAGNILVLWQLHTCTVHLISGKGRWTYNNY